MLLRHTLIYFFAKFGPGLINLLALILYTRLLDPQAYGRFSVIFSLVSFFNIFLYYWLRVSITRLRPRYPDPAQGLGQAILIGFVTASLLGVLPFVGALVWFSDGGWLVLLALLLMWSLGGFEMTLELLRSGARPARFGVTSLVKSVAALLISLALIEAGYDGVVALLMGLLLATLLGSVINLRLWREMIRPGPHIASRLRELGHFGWPLAVNFVLLTLVSVTDRIMLSAISGDSEAGIYSAADNLVQYSLPLLMVVVNLAAYPLIMQAFENQGEEAARARIRHHFLLLFGLGLPSSAGIIVLAEGLAAVVLGRDFSTAGAELIPYIALSAFLLSIKAGYFDLSFQLQRNTLGQVWAAGAAAAVNILLNLLLIPQMGMQGAAIASVAAALTAVVISALLGRRHFRLPFPRQDFIKIAAATLMMGGGLWIIGFAPGVVGLLLGVLCGLVVYGVMLLLFNPGNLTYELARRWRRVKSDA